MASNGTNFAHESLACTDPDDDTVWNAHASMINLRNALTVLIMRLSGGKMLRASPDRGIVRAAGRGDLL